MKNTFLLLYIKLHHIHNVDPLPLITNYIKGKKVLFRLELYKLIIFIVTTFSLIFPFY